MTFYRMTIGNQCELPLPNEYCTKLGIDIGDILAFSTTENGGLSIEKHSDQTLSDDEIHHSGYLSRVIELEGTSHIIEVK